MWSLASFGSWGGHPDRPVMVDLHSPTGEAEGVLSSRTFLFLWCRINCKTVMGKFINQYKNAVLFLLFFMLFFICLSFGCQHFDSFCQMMLFEGI